MEYREKLTQRNKRNNGEIHPEVETRGRENMDMEQGFGLMYSLYREKKGNELTLVNDV